MAEQAPTPATDADQPNQWKRATTALAVVAAIAIIGPVLASVATNREPATPAERREKKQEESREVTPEAAAQSTGGSIVSGYHSGGGSGSRGSASFDVLACNQAAAAARRQPAGVIHPGLASALDKAGGGLLGATANSLHTVEKQTDDDARAAEAYRACISQR